MSDNFQEIVDFIRGYYNKPEGLIGLHEPIFVGNERNYVMDSIDSTFVSSVGQYVNRLESMMQDYTGASMAVATVNGTAALHIALMVAGVGKDDLVITQPLTFIASCNAISYLGASPIFIDNDRKTLGLSAAKLKSFLDENARVSEGGCFHKTIGRKISACVPMHTFGHPVDLDGVLEVCAEFKIPVVEDAAESIGSRYKGKHTGTLGLLGAFSFNGNKTITSGGGGVVVTNNVELGKRAKHLTTQAKVPHAWEFIHDSVGYNYRMPNINAALACAQLEMVDKFVSSKRELAKKYKVFFSNLSIEFVDEPIDTFSNFWLNSVLFKDRQERDSFLEFSNSKNVSTRPVWTLMNKLPMFKDCITTDLSSAIDLESRLVSLPSSAKL
jgi:perosamine synthetase